MAKTAEKLIGKPCPKGHTLRYAHKPNPCVVCLKTAVAAYQAKNSKKLNAANKKWRRKNSDRKRASTYAWRAAHPDKVREMSARWRAKSLPRRMANNALRRARKRQQACTCCKPSEIVALYVAARLTGCEVDHVLALALGGRHCLKNLQILTKEAHKEKTKRDRLLIAQVRRLPVIR